MLRYKRISLHKTRNSLRGFLLPTYNFLSQWRTGNTNVFQKTFPQGQTTILSPVFEPLFARSPSHTLIALCGWSFKPCHILFPVLKTGNLLLIKLLQLKHRKVLPKPFGTLFPLTTAGNPRYLLSILGHREASRPLSQLQAIRQRNKVNRNSLFIKTQHLILHMICL